MEHGRASTELGMPDQASDVDHGFTGFVTIIVLQLSFILMQFCQKFIDTKLPVYVLLLNSNYSKLTKTKKMKRKVVKKSYQK